MAERFPTDILAELQITTPLAERHEAAIARYDHFAREITRLTEGGGSDQEWHDARTGHHIAEMDVLSLATKIEQLAA